MQWTTPIPHLPFADMSMHLPRFDTAAKLSQHLTSLANGLPQNLFTTSASYCFASLDVFGMFSTDEDTQEPAAEDQSSANSYLVKLQVEYTLHPSAIT